MLLSLYVLRGEKELVSGNVGWDLVFRIEASEANSSKIDYLDEATVVGKLPSLILREEGEVVGRL